MPLRYSAPVLQPLPGMPAPPPRRASGGGEAGGGQGVGDLIKKLGGALKRPGSGALTGKSYLPADITGTSYLGPDDLAGIPDDILPEDIAAPDNAAATAAMPDDILPEDLGMTDTEFNDAINS